MGGRLGTLLQYIGLAILVGALVLPSPEVLDTEWWHPIFDLAHVPVFGLLALWLLKRLDAVGVRHASTVTFLILAGFAIVVELAQSVVGRSASASDAIAGMAGALIAITGWRVWRPDHSPLLRAGHALASIVLTLAVLWHALLQLGAFWWQARSFPALGNFESSLEDRIWRPYPKGATSSHDCPGGATQGSHSLAVRTLAGTYSGIRYQANDRDWRGYDRVAFDVYLPVDGPRLAIRIDDDGDTTEFSARFNRSLALTAGWNEVRIPLTEIVAGPVDRELDLGTMRQLLVFSTPEEIKGGLFCLDHVRLE